MFHIFVVTLRSNYYPMDIKNTSYKQKANRNPLDFLRRWSRKQKNERFLRKWAKLRDGDTQGKYYVKRYYELNFAFYDLYWYIKSSATHQRVYTHYLRSSEEKLLAIVADVESTQLPILFENLSKGEI